MYTSLIGGYFILRRKERKHLSWYSRQLGFPGSLLQGSWTVFSGRHLMEVAGQHRDLGALMYRGTLSL